MTPDKVLYWKLMVVLTFCASILSFVGGIDTVESSNKDDVRYQLGKDRLESFERESKLPRYGSCWLKAIESLKSGCKELSEDTQHLLAFRFANCFLLKTGKPTYECDGATDIVECTARMTSDAYQVLTEFFTHTQNMCFFLQSQVWAERTESLVTHLVKTSDLVVDQMENASELQGRILKGQIDTIQNQEQLGQYLFAQSEKLGQSIEASKNSVDSIMKEFRNIASEQSTLMIEVYNRIMSLHSLLVGEFTGIYSVVLYVCTFIIVYFVTSTPRSSGARFWLNLLIVLNIAVERVIIRWNLSGCDDAESIQYSEEESTRIYNDIVICRKIFLLFGVAVYVCTVYRFKDYNRINNQLLVNLETKLSKINEENSELKAMLKSAFQEKKTAADETDSEGKIETVKMLSSSLAEHHQSAILPLRSFVRCSTPLDVSRISAGYETWSCEDDSEDSSSSCAEENDCTYTPKINQTDISGSTSQESSFYAASSHETTSSLLDELRVLRETTPFREIANFISGNSSFNTSTSSRSDDRHEQNDSVTKRRDRMSLPATCPYNLRSRVRNQPSSEKPVNEDESPESFGHQVKHLAKVSARNRAKVLATLKHLRRSDTSLSAASSPNSKSINVEN